MEFVLKIELPDRSETKQVSSERLRIGRDPDADLVLDAPEIDTEHATISQEDSGIVLFDQNSQTGTYIDDKRIQKLLLFDGDRITLGSFVLQIQLSGPEDLVVVAVSQTVRYGRERPAVGAGAAHSYELVSPCDF